MLIVSALAACATYSDWAGRMERAVAEGDPARAMEVLERHGGARARDTVLYLLNRAMLLRMDGALQDSNAAFEQAKALIEQLSALSISEQAGALTVNDLMRSYTSPSFERAMIHVYSALNYLELGEPERARVEALQLDTLAARLGDDGLPMPAFARYLSGMVFETLGEWDDAMIDYRKAYQAYSQYPRDYGAGVPKALKRDLLRLAARQGLNDELARYREEFGELTSEGSRPAQGEVVFLLHSGLAPIKRDTLTAGTAKDGQVVTVSMPYYARRRPQITSAQVAADGFQELAEPVEDLQGLALDTLEAQKPAILARAIARAVVKKKASSEAREKDETLGLMVNVAGALSERADTRSWSTLPNRIYLARLPLTAGSHTLHVELRDRDGRAAGEREYTVRLERGAKRFISLHRVAAEDLVARPPPELRRQRH